MRNKKLTELVAEFFKILDTEEETDYGARFKPTYISSCRVLHLQRLGEILPEMRRLMQKDKEHAMAMEKILTLTLKPGDIVVIKIPSHLPSAMLARTRDMVETLLAEAGHPNVKVLVLGGGTDIAVVRGCDYVNDEEQVLP